MANTVADRQGLLRGVTELTRGLETISRRVSRSIDRAVRRLENQAENRAEPTLDKPKAAKGHAHDPIRANVLLAVEGLILEAELAALEAIKNAANSQKTLEASQQLKALAQELVDLNRVVDAVTKDSLGIQDNRPAGRREPVMASSLPAKVISFTEAARTLSARKSQRRQA